MSHSAHGHCPAKGLLPNSTGTNASLLILVSALFLGGILPGSALGQTINNQTSQNDIGISQDTQTSQNLILYEDTPNAQTVAPVAPERQSLEDNMGAARRTNIRASEVEAGLRPTIEDDPYEPIGIRIGTFNLTTTIEQAIGYTTNRQNASQGDSGLLSESEASFQLQSNWSRHSLEIAGNGKYETDFDSQIEPSPSAQIEARLILDLIDGYEVTLGAGYNYEHEEASSVNLTQATIGEPGIHSYGTFAQVERSGQRLGFILRGGIERETYESAQLAGGGTLSQADRAYTSYVLQTRLSYNNNLALSPFIQANYTTNIYDLHLDRNGEQRDNTFYELRGGFSVNLSEKLVGEISAGYINQTYAEPGLVALSGLAIDSNINWSPQRDTNIELTLASELASSTNSGDSGAITYEGSISFKRRIRDNLELKAGIGIEHTNYEGLEQIDTTYNAQLGIEHWINRALSLTGRLAYETLDSSKPDSSYDDASVMVGVKFQR
ncbi:MAG: outer membrane beta-barrel protein [Hyphomicrobiales bacterium]|nr:outer membrane beta-barrel protein [Hyphomicrobiales bacterium]